MDGPFLWFANRGTGVVLLVLLTVSVLLGILAGRGVAGARVPRFVTQAVHRNVSLLAVVLLVVHVTTAVADEYVDIRWWQALVPVGATYEPFWLGLGTVALDLMVLVALTSLVRHRMPHLLWRTVHLSAYGAWVLAVAHGIGIGTDSAAPWMLWPTVASVSVVTVALVVRSVAATVARRPVSPASSAARPIAGARR